MSQLTEEQKERVSHHMARLGAGLLLLKEKMEAPIRRPLSYSDRVTFEFEGEKYAIVSASLLDSDSQAAAPPTEELTAASVLDQSLNTLRQIRDFAASSRSYVPQDNAAEMILRMEALGFGSQEPRRGNTLWAMVMDAADEIESLRKSEAATAMRDKCVAKVREFPQTEGLSEIGVAVVEMFRRRLVNELESLTLDQVKPEKP